MTRILCSAMAAMLLAVTSVWAQSNPALLSVAVSPTEPTVSVGAQVPLGATGTFDDVVQPTRQLGGGGGAPLWHVLFAPNIDVSACTPPLVTQYCCQSLTLVADGTFNEVWAPSSPNTLRVVGQLDATTVSANLSCVQTGTQTGTMSATWNGTHYVGTFTFANTGETLVKGLTWASSEPSIATVDTTGVVRGIAPGTATITATFGSTCWPGSPEPPGGCAGSVAGTATVTVTAATGPPGPPLTFAAQASGNLVRFSWAPPATGAPTTFHTLVGRQASGGPILATLGVDNETHVTLTLPSGSFFVTVRGGNASGEGPESNGVVVALPAPIVPPGAPTNLVAAVNGRTVSFSWNGPSNSAPSSGYRLLAALSSGGVPIASIAIPLTQRTLVVGNVPPGTYFVRVVATSPGPDGPSSNEETVTVEAPQPPAAPTLNPAQVNGGNVTLSWTPAASGAPATSFVLGASVTPDGPLVAVLRINGTSLTVSAPPGTYFVRMAAVNAAGQSTSSNQITVVVAP